MQARATITIDKLLVSIFDRLDPDHIIPDELSYISNGSHQYKAPDHFLFDRRILIERKTLSPAHDALLSRVNAVAKDQGEEFVIFGELSTEAIFRQLPDTDRARQAFARKSMNKFEQRVIEARDKFHEHSLATGVIAASRVVIISEEGDSIRTDGKLAEWFIGQLFMSRRFGRDKTGLIDSIIYIRDPEHTLGGDRSHWFKWVTRQAATKEQRDDVQFFGSLVHQELNRHFKGIGRNPERFGNPVELLI